MKMEEIPATLREIPGGGEARAILFFLAGVAHSPFQVSIKVVLWRFFPISGSDSRLPVLARLLGLA